MPKTTTPPFTQNVNTPAPTTLVNATGATGTTNANANTPGNTLLGFTAGGNDSVIKGIVITSDDTAANRVNFYLSLDAGTTQKCIGSVPVTGSATIAVVDALNGGVWLLSEIDQFGNHVIPMNAASRIYVGVQTAVAASKTVSVSFIGQDF